MRNPTIIFALLLCGVSCEPLGPGPGELTLGWKLGFGVECDDAAAGVTTIRATVLSSDSKLQVAEQTAACSAGSLRIERLPAGRYEVLVEAGDSADFTVALFSGRATGVVVAGDDVVSLGQVALAKIPPSQNPGELELSWTFSSGLCGANGVETVTVLVWRELVYSEHSRSYPCDLPAPGYVALKLPPAEYGILLEGRNAEGALVKTAKNASVTIEIGRTTRLTGPDAMVLVTP